MSAADGPASFDWLLTLEQLVFRDVAHDSRGAPDDELPRGDVLRHHRACPDERLLADLHAGADDRAAPDARAPPNRRALHQLLTPLGAPHEVVVRLHDARCDEDVLFELLI